ncbi:MAG: TrmO family methyltransferase [Candidatus Bathyarchaeia archaeon]|jgi:tRNA (Thr-GGU) A37 N-methylase
MDKTTTGNKEIYQMSPIGYVCRQEETIQLEILEHYREALKQLDHFSHVMVFWWAHKHDNPKSRNALQTRPPTLRTS